MVNHSTEVLNDLLVRIFMRSKVDISGRSSFPSSVLDFPIRLSERETANTMPRISRTTLDRISTSAKSGNLDDMLTLSMMYVVGLGVPESVPHSMSWANFSTLNTGPLDFEEATEDLEKHVARLTDDFVYPSIVDKIYKKLLPTYSKVEPRTLPADTYLLSPLFAGLRLYAIYRVHRTEGRSYSYLYDIRVGGLIGDRLCLELANKLNIPNFIGSHGSNSKDKRLTVPDYAGFMEEYTEGPAEFFVVAGTLAIPSNLKSSVKRVLPKVRSASDLFDYFVTTADVERKAIRDSPDYTKATESLAQVRRRIQRVKAGEELDILREAFKDCKKEHKRAKLKKDYDRAAAAKERSQSIKRMADAVREGKAIPILEKKVVKLTQQILDLEEMNLEYRTDQYAKYPEHFFRFIASDLYYGSKDLKIKPMPLGQKINSHLSGFGFSVANVNLFDRYEVLRLAKGKLTDKTYQKTLAKFSERFSEFKVTGLVARPVELGSVKKSQKLPVYIVTSE